MKKLGVVPGLLFFRYALYTIRLSPCAFSKRNFAINGQLFVITEKCYLSLPMPVGELGRGRNCFLLKEASGLGEGISPLLLIKNNFA